MHIKENLTNFLYDQKYFITLYDNYLYVFNYEDLVLLTEQKIILAMANFTLTIKGQNLMIAKMLPKELLIKGQITNVGKVDE